MMTKPAQQPLPDHVPPELAMALPLFSRQVIYDNPQEVLIPAMHADLPPVTYVTNIFPGDQPGWLLKNAEDVQAMLRDADNFTKNGMGKWAQNIGENWLVIPTEADPPIHTGYRKALNSHFAPQKMFAMKEQVRERARTLIHAFKDRGQCDFIEEFSEKFPIFIVLDLLGLPQERMAQFLKWEKEMLHSNDWEVRGNAVRCVKDYLLEEIEARRQQPRDDYISKVLTFEVDDRLWNDDEVLGHCFNLYIGGLDTVTSLLGNIFNYLASHPDKQNELRADPSLIVLAVEEFLRAFAPVTAFRIATKVIEIQGQKIMPGDYVAFSSPVVGRDPAFYDDPQAIRFDRKAPHMSLGSGIHKCLGMHLARLELQIAVEEFVTTLPEFRIKDGFKVPYFVGNILHVPDLHLQWD
ncbi:cytochrome P450 (plasmid) [Sphingobium sp. SJ10-10]|uniref:cytochrome P450 n=2 Tax=Sphingomonadaceae TaxID=41297 RepID=UPI0007700133|nr:MULTISPECIES: cytochrome P450 [unclassified Sphingobium]AMK25638.1 putative cytochrome P450 [Sphingobium sp. TKS]MCB4858868.1 cytochrome P450 [Sphingobium sp. PNB]MEC6700719.1 cytochrome P450 [Sphingobium sp. SJ10-10]NML87888.1 cytochrome P450 [Sphingobium sp. TB-6]